MTWGFLKKFDDFRRKAGKQIDKARRSIGKKIDDKTFQKLKAESKRFDDRMHKLGRDIDDKLNPFNGKHSRLERNAQAVGEYTQNTVENLTPVVEKTLLVIDNAISEVEEFRRFINENQGNIDSFAEISKNLKDSLDKLTENYNGLRSLAFESSHKLGVIFDVGKSSFESGFITSACSRASDKLVNVTGYSKYAYTARELASFLAIAYLEWGNPNAIQNIIAFKLVEIVGRETFKQTGFSETASSNLATGIRSAYQFYARPISTCSAFFGGMVGSFFGRKVVDASAGLVENIVATVNPRPD